MKYLILLLLIVSCKTVRPTVTRLQQQIVYFTDDRTGLCFAAVLSADPYEQNQIRSIINIPCAKIQDLKQ